MRGGKRLSAHVGAYFTWEFPNCNAIVYHGSGTPRRQVLPLGNKKIAIPKDDYFLATRNGLEPSTSSVTGWRANRLHHRARTRKIIAWITGFVKGFFAFFFSLVCGICLPQTHSLVALVMLTLVFVHVPIHIRQEFLRGHPCRVKAAVAHGKGQGKRLLFAFVP